jgi:hypothetical protein
VITQTGALTISARGYVKQIAVDRALMSAIKHAGLEDLPAVRECLVRFDFSQATWFDLSTLLWLVPVLSRLRRQANILELRLPRRALENDGTVADDPALRSAENLWSALQRWEFFEALSRCVDEPLNLLPPEQHSALLMPSKYSRAYRQDVTGDVVPTRGGTLMEMTIIDADSGTAQGEIDAAVANYNSTLVRNNLRFHCRWDERQIDDFTQIVVPHAIRNVGHADASFALVASRADEKYLHLCVTDNGSGIPHLLRHALHDQSLVGHVDSALIEYFAGQELHEKAILAAISDSELVVASTAENVTSDLAHRGMGLFDLKNLVLQREGELRIRSGKAMVTFDGSKRGGAASTPPIDDLIESPGTSVRVLLPRHGGAATKRSR